MNRYFSLVLCFMFASFGGLHAQSVNMDDVLAQIESHNLTLQALRSTLRSQEAENALSSALPDPEVEFAYLWGSPSTIGVRRDFSASQSFDFATVSGMRHRASESRNELARSEYNAQRISLLLQAKETLLDLVYYNSFISTLEDRLKSEGEVVVMYEKKLRCGQANQLEYNNILLKASDLRLKLECLQVERDAILQELRLLNGGEDIVLTGLSDYDGVLLPSDFEQWSEQMERKSPALSYVKAQVMVSEGELAIAKGEAAPAFSVGYMGEFVVGENFQGISMGISIPLWSAGRKVKQAQASLAAARCRQKEAQLAFYNNLEIQYKKTLGLQRVASTYEEALLKVSENVALLQRAMDKGAVSVLDYLLQMEMFYDAVEKSLDAQRSFQKAYARLAAFEL